MADDLGEERRCGPPRAGPMSRCRSLSSARSQPGRFPARPGHRRMPCPTAAACPGQPPLHCLVRPLPCPAAVLLGCWEVVVGVGAHRNRPGSAGDGGDREEWGEEREAWGLGEMGTRGDWGRKSWPPHRPTTCHPLPPLADSSDGISLSQTTRTHAQLDPAVMHPAATLSPAR